jgi:hypothetical protein
VSNFQVEITTPGRPWPFSWGPFGKRKVCVHSCSEGIVEIYQLDGGKPVEDPVTVDMYHASDRLATTIGWRGSVRLRRCTELPTFATRDPSSRRAT